MDLNSFDRRTFLRVGGLTFFGHLSFAEALALQAASPVSLLQGKGYFRDSHLVCRRSESDGDLGPQTGSR